MHGLVQFLDRNQTPKDRILTGRNAIIYKNATLKGAKLLFRHPGPFRPACRRHLDPRGPAVSATTGPQPVRSNPAG